jgi:hypothetical protein
LQANIPEGTVVAKLMAGITSLTRPEAVRALAQLSADEEARLAMLERSLLDLQANDPEKLIRQLSLRAERVRALARHLNNVEAALSDGALTAVFKLRTESRLKSEEAKRLRESTFADGLLTGTGSETWSGLWEAARRFSREQPARWQ